MTGETKLAISIAIAIAVNYGFYAAMMHESNLKEKLAIAREQFLKLNLPLFFITIAVMTVNFTLFKYVVPYNPVLYTIGVLFSYFFIRKVILRAIMTIERELVNANLIVVDYLEKTMVLATMLSQFVLLRFP